MTSSRSAALVFFLVLLATIVEAQTPQWIWGSWADDPSRPNGEVVYIERTFDLPSSAVSARGVVAVDNRCVVYANGVVVGQGDDWSRPTTLDLGESLKAGTNRISVRAMNEGGPAGVVFDLRIRCKDGSLHRVVSDATWLSARQAPPTWPGSSLTGEPARILGAYGMAPWGDVGLNVLKRFTALDGFSVSEVHAGSGSIVSFSLISDRLLLLGIEQGPVMVATDADGDGDFEASRVHCAEVRGAQGLLAVSDGAFVVGEGPEGPGLYRLNEEGQVLGCLGRLTGGGEHGPHAVIADPRGGLIVLLGNHSRLLSPTAQDSPYSRGYEGDALPRVEDPRGHAHGIKAPGGTIYQVDPEKKIWRLLAAGLRNSYDAAFDRTGELFVYDSDMEWDVGLPWYRPTRLYHVQPGADFGWRSGNGKWPSHRPDALPPAIDVGRGSPTGVVRYEGRRFPARFRGALLGADWSLGRVVAFHVQPSGRGYTGDVEILLSGQPLNVTDLAVDSAGDLLVSTGGRGTKGAIYRLRYEGPEELDSIETAARSPAPNSPAEWLSALGSNDRFARYEAARWLEAKGDEDLEAALALEGPARSEALVVLARRAGQVPEVAARVERMAAQELARGSSPGELAVLRALQLVAGPGQRYRLAPATLDLLDQRIPHRDAAIQREAAALATVGARPGLAQRLLDVAKSEPSRSEQLHLADCLNALPESVDSRAVRQAFDDWITAARGWPGGASFGGYLDVYQRRLRERFDDEDRARIHPTATATPALLSSVGSSARRERSRVLTYVRNTRGAAIRSRSEGARVFQRSCARCHRHGDLGGSRGPDLTESSGRYSDEDLLVAIMEPSRHIPDRFRSVDVFTKGGELRSGMLLDDDGLWVTVLDAEGQELRVPRDDVEDVRPSSVSAMPDGLLDGCTLVEIADLLAFLGERATPPPGSEGWQPLLEGSSLAGFTAAEGLWRVENGVLIGSARDLKQSSFLVRNRPVRDFRFEAEVFVVQGNSGVQFRSKPVGPFALAGYQADLGETWWGSLYEERGRGVLVKAANELFVPDLELTGFNHLFVEARGPRLRIELNGLATVIVEDDAASDGLLGVQLHSGAGTEVHLRGLRLWDLP